MSDHSTFFEATGSALTLTNAILLYQSGPPRNDRPYRTPPPGTDAFASIHAVEHDGEGRPTIASGVPLLRQHLRHWAEALGRTVVPEILPDNVLVSHPDMLAWWTPAQVRPGFFALSSPPDGLRVLSERTAVPVPFPPHLFIATRSGLGVYALKASERPTAETRVLHSPLLNVFIDGRLCWGDVPQPNALSISAIPEFERAAFDSWSTHPNTRQDLTITGKGGLIRLWDDLAARRARRFPTARLKPFIPGGHGHGRRTSADAMTVGRLISRQR